MQPKDRSKSIQVRFIGDNNFGDFFTKQLVFVDEPPGTSKQSSLYHMMEATLQMNLKYRSFVRQEPFLKNYYVAYYSPHSTVSNRYNAYVANTSLWM